MKCTLFSEIIIIALFINFSKGSVVVRKLPNNDTIARFYSVEASFGPDLSLWGYAGYLVLSEPLKACYPITNNPINVNNSVNLPMFLLVERGNCSFWKKAFNAQNAGFSAVIVYNNIDDSSLPMSKDINTLTIEIPAVMVGLHDGMRLKEFLYPKFYVLINSINSNFNPEDYIIPFLAVIVVCFLLSGLLVLARVCRDWRRRQRNRLTKSHLKKIPEKRFIKNDDPYETCAICLDDYLDGDKIRILPCQHAYHSVCIDPWLLKNKRVCPVCKKKVHIPGAPRRRSNSNSTVESSDSSQSESDNDSERGASESTHLLAGTSSTSRNAGTFQSTNASQLTVTVLSVNNEEQHSSSTVLLQSDAAPIISTEGVDNPTLQLGDEEAAVPIIPTHSQSTNEDAKEPVPDEVRISNESAPSAGASGVSV